MKQGQVCRMAEEVVSTLQPPDADDAAAHMYPFDLDQFKSGEHVASAFSIPVGSPDYGRSVPLFDAEYVKQREREAIAAALVKYTQGQEPVAWTLGPNNWKDWCSQEERASNLAYSAWQCMKAEDNETAWKLLDEHFQKLMNRAKEQK